MQPKAKLRVKSASYEKSLKVAENSILNIDYDYSYDQRALKEWSNGINT